ncbi:MAG: MmcB family DNA repair protein [Phycisphaerales bacterium]|nr:MmcB family DNA repair protein [Phycisphaerales bacterium]
MSLRFESEVLDALKAHFPKEAYSILPGVAEATGGGCRVADALMMSLWRSRGLALTGFEIKVSRHDWLRELKDPSKADPICKFCDHWYIAVGDHDVAKVEELPETWGLIVCDGKKVKIVKKAPKLSPVPISRAFLASILRRAQEYVAPRPEVTAAERELREDLRKEMDARLEAEGKYKTTERLRQSVADFETASGIKITEYTGRNMGAAVAAMQAFVGYSSLERRVATARREAESLRQLATDAEKSLAELAKAVGQEVPS